MPAATMTNGAHHARPTPVARRMACHTSRSAAADRLAISIVRLIGPTESWAGGAAFLGVMVVRRIGGKARRLHVRTSCGARAARYFQRVSEKSMKACQSKRVRLWPPLRT